MGQELDQFAVRFLTGRINWRHGIPRYGAIRNFGNIVSMVLYHKPPFQVELFIVPHDTSTFTEHRHPDVNVYEFHLTGDAVLYRDGVAMATPEYVQQWINGTVEASLIPIPPTCVHSGMGFTPYAFLSIQEWLNDVHPTSVGLNWIGAPSSDEQQIMWANDASVPVS